MRNCPLWYKFLFIILCNIPSFLVAQKTLSHNKQWTDSIFQIIRKDNNINAERKSAMADSLFISSTGDICLQLQARILQGSQLTSMGLIDSALTQLLWVNRNFKSPCDSALLVALYANLTNVYADIEEYERIDSIGRIVNAIWKRDVSDTEAYIAILINMGIAQALRVPESDIVGAEHSFYRAFHEAKRIGVNKFIQKALINLGSLKGMAGDLDSAYYFFNQAAGYALQDDDPDNYMSLKINLANLDIERGNYSQAQTTLDSLEVIATNQNNSGILSDILFTRADLAAKQNNFQKAYEYLSDYVKQYEIFMDEERVKAVTEMLEKYESEKKARQIQQLEIDNLDASLANERITNTRNRYMFIGLGVLIIALALLSRLQYVHKSRIAIRAEKEISDGLLLNILPASVAAELKSTGTAAARHWDNAIILFSDFKDFTGVAGHLSPTDLLEELNACFKKFDEITTKYGIEKIKTIGDSYMAAGSVPDTNKATPTDVVRAGLEMQQFVIERKKDRETRNLPAFEMRLGIHSGPVVAGIVGMKKFQYDLWGDTVNIASRMESSGETGRVNISEATYTLISNEPGLRFTPRGRIEAKGMGPMTMYFVDLATAPVPEHTI